MLTMKISWRPRAADDFEALITQSTAGHVAHASRDKSLVETRRQGVRELPVEGTPYVVVSRRHEGEILILRMFSNGSAVQSR
jgi:plasmid stabilization system protein ParE